MNEKKGLFEQSINGKALQNLTRNDLASLGVKRFDVRCELFKHIQNLIQTYPQQVYTQI